MFKLLGRVMGPVLIAGAAGVWFLLGGIPTDYAGYGAVAIPGAKVVMLPEGDVRLNFGGRAYQSGSNRRLQDQPPGLQVSVVSVATGQPLRTRALPSWLMTSTSGNRGHEPFRKVEIPKAGRYVIATRAAGGGGSGRIEIGEAPWTPFGSPLVGSLLILFAGGALWLAGRRALRR